MNHLQAAALRILESTPRERIRTHEQKLVDPRWRTGKPLVVPDDVVEEPARVDSGTRQPAKPEDR